MTECYSKTKMVLFGLFLSCFWGFANAQNAEKLETLDGLLEYLCEQFTSENFTPESQYTIIFPDEGVLKFRDGAFFQIAPAIAQFKNPKAIPYLIGAIDADNSAEATVHGIGNYGLRELTGVEFSFFHDGAFWRRWWERNKANYPEEVQKIAIPDLPKTPHGKSYEPYPEKLETLDGLLEYLCDCFEPENQKRIQTLPMGYFAQDIVRFKNPKAIPYLIGAIDADNSYDTVYWLGHFGLHDLTGVKYRTLHDGAFWRRWWEKNKTNFPKEVQRVKIPDLPKTSHGETYVPYLAELDTLDGLLEFLRSCLVPENQDKVKAVEDDFHRADFLEISQTIAQFEDHKAIPYLIGAIDAADSFETIRGIGAGIWELTNARDVFPSSEWWKKWWEENKKNYPEAVQNIPIPSVHDAWGTPDLSKELALWWQKRAVVMIQKKEAEKQEMEERVQKELADVPAERLHVEGNEKMEYFLIGVDKNKPVPESGYRLVVVMPGGDGSADFHPFVRRIWKYAMNESGSEASKYLIAQPIAVRWTPNQQVVWATEKAKVEKQEFSTEVFVESVIADVAKRTKVDPKSVFTLSWSSSGPAAYAIALQDKTTITGSYILMSVFRPNEYALENAKDRLFAIQHSPEDRVCPFRMAKDAEEQLTKHGAVVKFTEYSGGHGWSGNIYGRICENLDWLSHGSR